MADPARRSASLLRGWRTSDAGVTRQHSTTDEGGAERWRWTRRLSTTAAPQEREREAPPHPTFRSDVAARAYLARQRAVSARRALLDTDGTPLRLVTTRAGGDCGFETGRGHGPSARELRRITRAHVLAQREMYAHACGGGIRAVDAFCRSVVRPGLAGHWLGSSWGALELVAVARAVGVNLRVYTFDVKTQRFRAYFEELAGPPEESPVRLLFTGDAERGHFDHICEEKRTLFPYLWRRRFVRKLESRSNDVWGVSH